jgi:hypothetical protein
MKVDDETILVTQLHEISCINHHARHLQETGCKVVDNVIISLRFAFSFIYALFRSLFESPAESIMLYLVGTQKEDMYKYAQWH